MGKNFTVSIGEYGVVVALHNGSDVQNKILIASLSEEHKPQLTDLFTSNQKARIYLLVDTNSQTYKRKSYPLVREFDFRKIAKRDADKENDAVEKSFKSFYYAKNREQKKWDCTFVSAFESDEIKKWEEFLMSLPNVFVGIYMLPIETYHLAKMIFDIAKSEKKVVETKDQLISFTIQNKISGVRQTIFYNQTIVFTRVVHYDIGNKNFAERFEQDLFRTSEYLKMIFPNLKIQDVAMINVLSDDIIEKIKYSKNHDLRFINYSPFEIATKAGITNAITKNTSNFSDVLIANFFVGHLKKILKFQNPRISFLYKLNFLAKAILHFNFATVVGIIILFANIIITNHEYNQKILQLNKTRIGLERRLQDASNAALDIGGKVDKDENANLKAEDKNIMANKIVDFGKIDEVLSVMNNSEINDIFNRMVFIQKYGTVIDSFRYQLSNFNSKATSFSNQKAFFVGGTIFDPSGDIEILFRKFDSLSLDTKNKFPEYEVKYSELSKNVDFSKKYYSFPFDLILEKKLENKK